MISKPARVFLPPRESFAKSLAAAQRFESQGHFGVAIVMYSSALEDLLAAATTEFDTPQSLFEKWI